VPENRVDFSVLQLICARFTTLLHPSRMIISRLFTGVYESTHMTQVEL
jgi:hypothetical protein